MDGLQTMTFREINLQEDMKKRNSDYLGIPTLHRLIVLGVLADLDDVADPWISLLTVHGIPLCMLRSFSCMPALPSSPPLPD
jgi:hypothetical protein